MKRVGALTGSAPLSDLARPRGPAIERTAIDAARDVPASIETSLGEARDLRTTPADEVESDAYILRVGPEYTR
jgi:hypothetical protein